MIGATKRLIRFGALGALCVVVLGGGLYLFDRSGTATPATVADTARPPAATSPRAATTATAKPPANADEQPVPSQTQTDQAARLIGEARRLAGDGKFPEATAKLDQAEKIIPGMAETAQARHDIADMSTPEGQLALQLGRARSAIEQDDSATAEKALAEAERLNPQAPEIASLRQALQADEQKDARRSSHITELLTTMREAIARQDFAAADRALNEAARIDVRDPAIDKARVELTRAHDAARKANAEK